LGSCPMAGFGAMSGRMGNAPSANADYLVRGVIHALEQCGLLLRDARALYNIGSYGTAVAVAAFAREELGRSDILLELWKKVSAGETVTIGEIEQRCDNHLEKQRRAVRGMTMRTDRSTGLGKFLNARFQADVHSEERKAADEQPKGIDETLRKRAPEERHETDAANNYATELQIVEPEFHVVDDARFYEALANWPECPTLPAPPWLHGQEA
jgi:AbiV family abortive infection protein